MLELAKKYGGLKPNKDGGAVHSYLDALIYQQKDPLKVWTLGNDQKVRKGIYEGVWVVGYLITNKQNKDGFRSTWTKSKNKHKKTSDTKQRLGRNF